MQIIHNPPLMSVFNTFDENISINEFWETLFQLYILENEKFLTVYDIW